MLLVLLGICLLYSKQILIPEGVYVDQTRNTDGTLSFSVHTITYNGNYAPRNVFAIWITNSSNTFVKSLKVCGNSHRSALVRWRTSSNNNTTGAITSATLNSHQTHTVTWNAQNYQNVAVADGNYNVNVEFAEHSATTSNQGKYKVVTFALGSALVDTTPTSDSWFNNMHLVWTPTVRNGTLAGTITTTTGSLLSGATISAGTLTATSSATGSYSMNLPAGSYSVTCTKTGYTTQTVNNIIITDNQTTTRNFSMTTSTPGNGTISGTVSYNGTPLGGATITAGGNQATSGSNGSYTMSVTPGNYNLSCAATGYVTQTQNNIFVMSGEVSTVNFSLSPVDNEDNLSASFDPELQQNSPNPLKTFTNIRYYIAKNAPVSLNIYNEKGQRVAHLINTPQTKGWHETIWNGYLANGTKAAPGKYIYRLVTGGKTIAKTLTIIN